MDLIKRHKFAFDDRCPLKNISLRVYIVLVRRIENIAHTKMYKCEISGMENKVLQRCLTQKEMTFKKRVRRK